MPMERSTQRIVKQVLCVLHVVFIYWWGLNLNTQTHGDLCHGGDLN